MAAPITELFNAWQRGDEAAGVRLFEECYPTLKQLVRSQLRKVGGVRSLQTTEYLSEVFLELERDTQLQTVARGQFYAMVATIVRRLVVDHYRAANAQRRFGGQQRVDVAALEHLAAPDDNADYWITLDRCIDELRGEDALASRIVELRFFAGLTLEETGEVLDRSTTSVHRAWQLARAMLIRDLQSSRSDPL